MALIQVTFEQLKAQAETLRQLNETFKANIAELDGIETQLVSMWDGQSKDVFHNVFQSDKAQMEYFYNVMQQYVQALLIILSKYQQAEGRNLETAANRTYR